MNEKWENNPKLKEIDKNKLDMLLKLAEQGNGKNASDMLPFLMNAASSGKKNGLQFSQDEIATVLDVIKTGRSRHECAKIDRIVNLMKMIH